MTVLKIIDTRDKLLISLDGTDISHAVGYELSRTPSGTIRLHLALAISDAKVQIMTDKDNVDCLIKNQHKGR